MPDTERRPARAVARLRARTLVGDRPYLVGLGAAAAVAVVVVSGPVQTWLEQRDRVEGLEVTVGAVQDENAELDERVRELRDPDHVELLAREEQGMVRPGEQAYVVVPPEVEEPVIGAEPPPAGDDDRGTLRRLWDAVAGLFGR